MSLPGDFFTDCRFSYIRKYWGHSLHGYDIYELFVVHCGTPWTQFNGSVILLSTLVHHRVS